MCLYISSHKNTWLVAMATPREKKKQQTNATQTTLSSQYGGRCIWASLTSILNAYFMEESDQSYISYKDHCSFVAEFKRWGSKIELLWSWLGRFYVGLAGECCCIIFMRSNFRCLGYSMIWSASTNEVRNVWRHTSSNWKRRWEAWQRSEIHGRRNPGKLLYFFWFIGIVMIALFYGKLLLLLDSLLNMRWVDWRCKWL